MNYRVQVNTVSCGPDQWSGNAVTYETPEAAESAAKDLFMRWTAVRYWRVVDEDDTVHATNAPAEPEAA